MMSIKMILIVGVAYAQLETRQHGGADRIEVQKRRVAMTETMKEQEDRDIFELDMRFVAEQAERMVRDAGGEIEPAIHAVYSFAIGTMLHEGIERGIKYFLRCHEIPKEQYQSHVLADLFETLKCCDESTATYITECFNESVELLGYEPGKVDRIKHLSDIKDFLLKSGSENIYGIYRYSYVDNSMSILLNKRSDQRIKSAYENVFPRIKIEIIKALKNAAAYDDAFRLTPYDRIERMVLDCLKSTDMLDGTFRPRVPKEDEDIEGWMSLMGSEYNWNCTRALKDYFNGNADWVDKYNVRKRFDNAINLIRQRNRTQDYICARFVNSLEYPKRGDRGISRSLIAQVRDEIKWHDDKPTPSGDGDYGLYHHPSGILSIPIHQRTGGIFVWKVSRYRIKRAGDPKMVADNLTALVEEAIYFSTVDAHVSVNGADAVQRLMVKFPESRDIDGAKVTAVFLDTDHGIHEGDAVSFSEGIGIYIDSVRDTLYGVVDSVDLHKVSLVNFGFMPLMDYQYVVANMRHKTWDLVTEESEGKSIEVLNEIGN